MRKNLASMPLPRQRVLLQQSRLRCTIQTKVWQIFSKDLEFRRAGANRALFQLGQEFLEFRMAVEDLARVRTQPVNLFPV